MNDNRSNEAKVGLLTKDSAEGMLCRLVSITYEYPEAESR